MSGRSHYLAIDTDPGVDDALAFALALASPEVRVVLFTTVAGNVAERVAARNAARLLGWLRPDPMPRLARGAAAPLEAKPVTAKHIHGADGLGGITRRTGTGGRAVLPAPAEAPRPRGEADRAIVEAARAYGSRLTVVALGPLTNIARAIRLDARAMRGVRRLVVMGGAVVEPGNVTPAAEFNIYADPHAADAVFTAGLPTTLVPLDVTHRVRLGPATVRARLKGQRSLRARLVRALTREMLNGRFAADGIPLHDPLAVAVAIEPSLVKTEPLIARVETTGEHTLGMTVFERRVMPHRPLRGRAIDVAIEVHAKAALDLFYRRVLDARA